MITNIKKVMVLVFGASVIMKQLSSFVSICMFKMKSILKHFYLQECQQNLQLQILIQANITVGKITKILPRTTTLA